MLCAYYDTSSWASTTTGIPSCTLARLKDIAKTTINIMPTYDK